MTAEPSRWGPGGPGWTWSTLTSLLTSQTKLKKVGEERRRTGKGSGTRREWRKCWRDATPGRIWTEGRPCLQTSPCVWTVEEKRDKTGGVHRSRRWNCIIYLFSLGQAHPQFESLDEELHHLMVLRFDCWLVQFGLLLPLKHSDSGLHHEQQFNGNILLFLRLDSHHNKVHSGLWKWFSKIDENCWTNINNKACSTTSECTAPGRTSFLFL